MTNTVKRGTDTRDIQAPVSALKPFNSPQSAWPENAYDWYSRNGNGPCTVLIHHGPDVQRWAYRWGVYNGREIIRYSLAVDYSGNCLHSGASNG